MWGLGRMPGRTPIGPASRRIISPTATAALSCPAFPAPSTTDP